MRTFETSVQDNEYRPFVWERNIDFERDIRENVLARSSISLQHEAFTLKAIAEYAVESDLLDFFHELAERDPRTYAHVMRVSLVAIDVALQMGIHGNELKEIGLGTMLHDIGKEKIPLTVLHKPGQGRLTSEEWKLIQSHTVEGLEMVRSDKRFLKVAGDQLIQAIIVGHHGAKKREPYPIDLSGRGGAGEDIYDLHVKEWTPEMWRALRLSAAADTFDGISAKDRAYHPGRTDPKEIFEVMKSELEAPETLLRMAVGRFHEKSRETERAAA